MGQEAARSEPIEAANSAFASAYHYEHFGLKGIQLQASQAIYFWPT